ncbi:Hypothetical predicted protein, partial [Olea europaea subsp. europaea]
MEGAANYQMSYVQPASELIQEKDRDILVLNLPGFKKELLKAELTSESRILKISGARQLEDKRWIGFDKDFPVSPNCDTQKISARFDNSKLFVTMPKLISPAAKEEGKLQPLETRKPQKPTKKPFAAPDVNMPKLISQPLETRKPQKPTKKPFAAPDISSPISRLAMGSYKKKTNIVEEDPFISNTSCRLSMASDKIQAEDVFATQKGTTNPPIALGSVWINQWTIPSKPKENKSPNCNGENTPRLIPSKYTNTIWIYEAILSLNGKICRRVNHSFPRIINWRTDDSRVSIATLDKILFNLPK